MKDDMPLLNKNQPTNQIGFITLNHIIVYRLFLLDRKVWKHNCQLFVSNMNTWYYITVQTQYYYKQIIKNVQFLKRKKIITMECWKWLCL